MNVHVSFDDVWATFLDISQRGDQYRSIFESPFLGRLKRYHEKYGCRFTLYIFAGDTGCDFVRVTEQYQHEFAENSEWLKFGYHGLRAKPADLSDTETSAVIRTFFEKLERVVGKCSITHTARLHFFSGTYLEIQTLKSLGVTTLFCADDDRVSYDLTTDEVAILGQKGIVIRNGITYFRTDFRIERDPRQRISFSDNVPIYAAFSHEGCYFGKKKLLYYLKLKKFITTVSRCGAVFTA
jgi:hypothetical protein